MTDTALARRENLPAPIAALVGDGMPYEIVEAALRSEYKDLPPEAAARALYVCLRQGLDPLRQHVVQFTPRKQGDPWPKPFITAEGRIHIANRHPDYAGITFSEPRVIGDEVQVDAWCNRKSWPKPCGPVTGRAQLKVKPRNGNPFADPWAEEKARTRAVRNVLRFAFGEQLPDPDADEPRMRDDQRRHLFFIANALGWDDERRHTEASRVLGRDVESWTELSESDAAQLQIAWEPLVEAPVDVDPVTGEILSPPADPVQGPSEEEAPPSNGPVRGSTQAVEETSRDAVAPAPSSAPATQKQKTLLATLASKLGWDAGKRLSRAGVASFNDLTKQRASELIEEWLGLQDGDPTPGAGAPEPQPPQAPQTSTGEDAWDGEDRQLVITRISMMLDELFGASKQSPVRVRWVVDAARASGLDDASYDSIANLSLEQLGAIEERAARAVETAKQEEAAL